LPDGLCRGDTLRLEIWGWVADEVRSHPLLGKGMSFRFPPPDHFHAHNGLFGMALAFGVPALLLFLGVLYRVGARAQAAAPSGMTILFATLTLTFGFAYMGSDLSSPVAFVRNHYLFLWLPVSMLMLAGVPQPEQGERGANASPSRVP
jgi:O-antigen ligase